jgi:hypothetical protein
MLRHRGWQDCSRSLGRLRRRGENPSVGKGHHPQCLFDDKNHDGPHCTAHRRSRGVGLRCACCQILAGIRANGKERIKVSHLMSHSSGLSGWKEPITTAEDLYDWEKMTSLLAAQAPLWEPEPPPNITWPLLDTS